jgi:hypothetical protein
MMVIMNKFNNCGVGGIESVQIVSTVSTMTLSPLPSPAEDVRTRGKILITITLSTYNPVCSKGTR